MVAYRQGSNITGASLWCPEFSCRLARTLVVLMSPNCSLGSIHVGGLPGVVLGQGSGPPGGSCPWWCALPRLILPSCGVRCCGSLSSPVVFGPARSTQAFSAVVSYLAFAWFGVRVLLFRGARSASTVNVLQVGLITSSTAVRAAILQHGEACAGHPTH